MIKLSEVPLEEIKPGLKIVSARGGFGHVTQIKPYDSEDYVICIDWDNGNKSEVWHFWCDKVTVADPQE